MPLDLGPRLHAFVHGLFRPSDAAEVETLYHRVSGMFTNAGVGTDAGRRQLITLVADTVSRRFGIATGHPQHSVIRKLCEQLFAYEGLFALPEIDWAERRTIAAWWDIRDDLNAQRQLVETFEDTCAHLTMGIIGFLAPIYAACPTLLEDEARSDGIAVTTELVRSVGDIGAAAEAVLTVAFDEDYASPGLYSRLRDRLERNLVAASGGNPADVRGFSRAPKLPSQAEGRDPGALITTYLGGTPLAALFDQQLSFTIPTTARFEHHHIVAGSGHGKTQTLQYLIGQDLEAVADGRRSVVVLDSQGDLIQTISSLAVFAPGSALHERIVVIDPSDVEWPVSLNLFDVGQERLATYDALERERLTNSILELYDFVLGTLLSAEMTQKQNVIFRYVTRLMLHIPDATIHTLRELMEPGSQQKFAADIAKLTGTARRFFETEFASKEFDQTRKQVLRRLWGILENQTFERMFAHPRSKLDLFGEMNAGKIILINTAKDLLKEQGTEIFGRFFIALIAQAAQERATLPANERMPTFVYVDEAADYFDRNIGIILAQARKYNVGMVLAHQYLGQLEPKLQEAFAANTAIKFAGGVSAKDARTLAPMLYSQPELIESQPKGSFAAHIRGVTKGALPLQFPFGDLEAKPVMTRSERAALRDRMRKRYAVHYSTLEKLEPSEETQDEEPSPPKSARGNTRRKAGHIDTDAGEKW